MPKWQIIDIPVPYYSCCYFIHKSAPSLTILPLLHLIVLSSLQPSCLFCFRLPRIPRGKASKQEVLQSKFHYMFQETTCGRYRRSPIRFLGSTHRNSSGHIVTVLDLWHQSSSHGMAGTKINIFLSTIGQPPPNALPAT